MINKEKLFELYTHEGKSMQEIAILLGCSVHTVVYWMQKYDIKRRSISEAVYRKCNPGGDPFEFVFPTNQEEAQLFGLGIGLYWGEGTKANESSVRLANTNPELIKKFIEFLITFFNIKKGDLRFGLQIFTDIDPKKAMDFWIKKLTINRDQFYKTIITKSGSLGTYRKKSEYGVISVMYHNTKMRNVLVGLLPM
ncbi:MAG: helix-turn-helix domain-containing protein [Parcubacteria group bacterium]|nr:helix-turn-helix domain-containing protein [Parcubacteria group bacterium]